MTPLVQVWPDKFVNGILSVEGPHRTKQGKAFEPILGDLTTLTEALETEHPTAAMITTYAVTEDGKPVPSPLIRKPCLKSVRTYKDPDDDHEVKRDIVLTSVGIDIDTPGHAPLTEDLLADFALAIAALPAPFDKWHSWYTSRHGIRLFFALSEYMPVDEAEPRVLTFLHDLTKEGLEADLSCKDWTHRFLAPKVVRDHTKTSNDALYCLNIAEGEPTIDLSAFVKAPTSILARQISFERRENYPSQDECASRLTEKSAKGKDVASRFLNAAKKVLKKWPEYYEQLITQNDPLPDDEKHAYMLSMFGLIVPPLIRRAGAKAVDIFALVYDPILAWENCKSDPHANIWDALQHVYQIEAAKYNEEQLARAAKAEEGMTHMQTMVRGMRSWCAAAPSDPEAGAMFVMRHLLANIDKQYYPMGRHGQYDQSAVSRDQLVTHIRNGYLNEIIETETQEGTVPATKLVDTHSTIVHDVVFLPQCEDLGIEGIDTPKATLRLPMYRRNPFLTPCYHPEVDEWLKRLAGEHYAVLTRWIGYSLSFEEGSICALSIKGAPDIGKKLLIMGLAECLEVPFVIPGTAIDASHNESMLKSPFLHVNETWPMMRNHSSPSDRFKQLTAGDPIYVNPKFKSEVMVRNPLRIVVTANNHDPLHDMIRGRNLRPADREAIGQRIYHFDTGKEAAYYLRSLGGSAYTAREGGRWIGGDSGQPSDSIVARHFLWLYENRPPRGTTSGDKEKSDRLLVMGNCASEESTMFQMAAQSENLPVVMRGILFMCNNPGVCPNDICIGKGKVYLTMHGLHNAIVHTLEERIGERALEAAVESISKDEKPMVGDDGRYFTEINMEMVLAYAARWGIDTRKVREGMGK